MNYTASELREEMLESLQGYDKTKGTWLWDIFSAAAILGEKLWEELNDIRTGYYPDKLTGAELDVYCKSWRNIERKAATYAEGYINVKGSGTLEAGLRCQNSTSGIYYEIMQASVVTDGSRVRVRCIDAGSVGNCEAGRIDKLLLSSGKILSCTNENAFTNGIDEESDAALRQRFYDSMLPYGSGNKKHYEMWAREIAGVGLAKVQRTPDGPGTVKVVIIAQNGNNASDELVAAVQEYLDPALHSGEGVGMAPVGAVVSVCKASEVSVSIAADVEIKGEYDENEVAADVKSVINDYIGSLSFKNNELSYGMIYNLIFDVGGVVDCENLTINGDKVNVYCGDDEIFAPIYSLSMSRN